jgi:hypothetical protein
MTDMEEIFDSAVYQGSYMALPLDLSGWNTSAVWNMKDAFAGASLFVSGIGSWDTSSATDNARDVCELKVLKATHQSILVSGTQAV